MEGLRLPRQGVCEGEPLNVYRDAFFFKDLHKPLGCFRCMIGTTDHDRFCKQGTFCLRDGHGLILPDQNTLPVRCQARVEVTKGVAVLRNHPMQIIPDFFPLNLGISSGDGIHDDNSEPRVTLDFDGRGLTLFYMRMIDSLEVFRAPGQIQRHQEAASPGSDL